MWSKVPHRTGHSFLFPCAPLFVILLSFQRNAEGAVEFSQFHLPPCCHIAAYQAYSPVTGGVASAPSEQNGTVLEPAYPRENTGSGEDPDAGENSLFKLIVPLKFSTGKAATKSLSVPSPEVIEASPPDNSAHQDQDPEETYKLATPTTTPPPLTRTTTTVPIAAAAPIQNDTGGDPSSSDVFNVFLYRELEKMRENEGILPPLIHPDTPEYLSPPHPPPPSQKSESVFDKIARLGYSMSERLQQLSSTFQTMTAVSPPAGPVAGGSRGITSLFQSSPGPFQMYKNLFKRQAPDYNQGSQSSAPLKMPAVWIKNLRKALYQSLSSRNKVYTEGDSQLLWKNLRGAKLKFVDLTTHQTSDLPEEIYLPAGQGPIVSGITTLAGGEKWEIRIPSELYTKDSHGSGSGEGIEDQCECQLINNGDMILAYWSISRVVTEDGQPALQYLVYPHPYPQHTINPPTPPQLIPLFTGQGPHDFKPSPHDPLPNYIKEISRNHHTVPIITDARNRHPKLYQGPLTHPEGEYPLPTPPVRGVPIAHENGKYTDDFLLLYRDAINHHFQNIDSMKAGIPLHGDGVPGNLEDYQHHQFPATAGSLPPPPPVHQGQHHIPDIPFGGGYLANPPTSIPGLVTPLEPTAGVGGHLNEHPKSIQDILTPYVPPPPPISPHHLPPPQHNHNPNPQSPENPRSPPKFYNNNVDDGLYYDDDVRKYQNPNVPPPPFKSNPRLPANLSPDYQNGVIPYNDPYHNNNGPVSGGKPYYPSYDDKRPQPPRDLPKKQAYIKEYYHNHNYKSTSVRGKNRNFAPRIGGRVNNLGGASLNDIDNPDGYILDF